MADLTAQVRELNIELRELRKELATEYAPRDEQQRRRRGAVLLVLAAMAGSLLVNNAAISQCFLSPPHGVGRQVCSVLFPGYGTAMREGDQRLAQFQELLRTIPENARRVSEVERRVEKLERQRR